VTGGAWSALRPRFSHGDCHPPQPYLSSSGRPCLPVTHPPPPTVFGASATDAPVTPEADGVQRRQRRIKHAGDGSPAGVTEARGPLGLRRRWSLWIVGRWPSSPCKIPGGSRSAGAAVRRRVRGVWTPHLRAVCRSLPAPARASLAGSPACGPDLKGSVGAIGWSQRPAVRRGCRWWPGASLRPFQFN
jgi:hypothetical protein